MIYLIIIIVGLIIGSFLNVVIWRYPEMLKAHWRQECKEFLEQPSQTDTDSPPNLLFPASNCRSCHSRIKPWHNIPVISYILLKGRCANCQARISALYPIVEISTVLLAIIAISLFGISFKAFAVIIFSWALLTMSIIDLNTQLLPDLLTLGFLWLGLLLNTQQLFTTAEDAIIASIVAYLTLWLFAKIFKLIAKREGMGFGDFKMFAMFGAWLGTHSLLNIILIAAVLGLIVSLILRLLHKHKPNQTIPFGPYLAISGYLTLIYGPFSLQWIDYLVR